MRRLLPLAIACLALAAEARAQRVEVPEFVAFNGGAEFAIAAGSDGNFVVLWDDFGTGYANPETWQMFSRVWAASGSAVTTATRVDVSGRLMEPAVAALGAGYVGSFTAVTAAGTQQINARLLDGNGLGAGPLVRIDADDQVDPDGSNVAVVASRPVFAWNQNDNWARLFEPTLGNPGSPIQLAGNLFSWNVQVDAFASSYFVTAWRDAFTASTSARLFDAAGNPITAAFLVDGATSPFEVRVAVSPLGDFAVGTPHQGQVWVHRYRQDGSPIGSPILVADIAPGRFVEHDLEFDDSGDLFVVWSGVGTSGGNLPIQARIIDGQTGAPAAAAVELSPSGYHVRASRLAGGRFAVLFDDGGGSGHALIASACTVIPQGCGDGILDPQCELCDDGAANSDSTPDACRTNCRPAHCGDGVTDSSEECDDGNAIGNDGCDQTCHIEICGNGVRQGGEVCDDGNTVDGDGCDSNCTLSACGNGIVATRAGEECDDGNRINGDGCDAACLIESCGNGRIEGNEECDDGNNLDGDACESNCTLTRCGNDVLDDGEECDDGNVVSGDGCDRVCLVESCGNGRREGLEECDDGNLVDADGCNTDCTLTPRIDAAMIQLKPLAVSLPPDSGQAETTIQVTVRNAEDAGMQVLRLSAADGTCPTGTVVSAPDFRSDVAGTQDSITLPPGAVATANIGLHFSRSTLPGLTARVPRRCVLQISLLPANGSVDSKPSNNSQALAVDVTDHGAGSASLGEGFVRRMRPLSLHIPAGLVGLDRDTVVAARSAKPGETFTFTVDQGDCPIGTVSILKQTPRRAKLRVRASRAFVTTTSLASPDRCTAVITATPSVDSDPDNNSTLLVIDVTDHNDL